MSEIVGFRNSENLTRWVRYMLYIQILVAVVSIASDYLEHEILSDYQNGVYTSQALAVADGEASDFRQGVIGIAYIAVFIVSGFLILRWIHRANFNARQLGAANMKFTPGWSIGYYFIPILTLWKPYQAMKEIWKASKNPSDWEHSSTSPILPIWWTLWLISGFLDQAIFRFSKSAESLQELLNINLITQVSNVLDIALALVLLSIVNNIYHMQMSSIKSASRSSDLTGAENAPSS